MILVRVGLLLLENNPVDRNIFQKVQIFFVELLATVHWKQKHRLSDDNRKSLSDMLTKDYYIIATRRDNQLTTFFINLGHFCLTGNWGYYSHVLMNLEDEVKDPSDFRLIEATGKGIHFSSFDEVFDGTYAVALVKPKHITLEEWTAALDNSTTYLGRPYDNLFDLKSDLEINCVELIRLALVNVPEYKTKFAEFEKMIEKKKKLTPDMFAECPDFEVVFRIKR